MVAMDILSSESEASAKKSSTTSSVETRTEETVLEWVVARSLSCMGWVVEIEKEEGKC